MKVESSNTRLAGYNVCERKCGTFNAAKDGILKTMRETKGELGEVVFKCPREEQAKCHLKITNLL